MVKLSDTKNCKTFHIRNKSQQCLSLENDSPTLHRRKLLETCIFLQLIIRSLPEVSSHRGAAVQLMSFQQKNNSADNKDRSKKKNRKTTTTTTTTTSGALYPKINLKFEQITQKTVEFGQELVLKERADSEQTFLVELEPILFIRITLSVFVPYLPT